MPGAVALIQHPDDAAGPVRGVRVGLVLRPDPALALVYSVEGGVARLRVPKPAANRRADGLWTHTCLEAFVARAGEEAYHEFNFSPSGEWAAYAFRRYREGRSNLPGDFDPQIKVHRDANVLELSATIPVSFLPPAVGNVPLRVGLAAVIEEQEGRLSYWALRHPPGKPDFHHPDAFALELKLRDA